MPETFKPWASINVNFDEGEIWLESSFSIFSRTTLFSIPFCSKISLSNLFETFIK